MRDEFIWSITALIFQTNKTFQTYKQLFEQQAIAKALTVSLITFYKRLWMNIDDQQKILRKWKMLNESWMNNFQHYELTLESWNADKFVSIVCLLCSLFRSTEDVNVTDVSLIDFIGVKGKFAVFLPHTAGRYQSRAFRKTQCPIVERLVNALMFHGRNTGKKA